MQREREREVIATIDDWYQSTFLFNCIYSPVNSLSSDSTLGSTVSVFEQREKKGHDNIDWN